MKRSLYACIAGKAGLWILIGTTLVTHRSVGGGAVGLIAEGPINLIGGAILDSYNSSVGPYGSVNFGTNAVAITNTNIYLSGIVRIYGVAITGPGGTVSTGSGARVGDANANVQLMDVSVPPLSNYFSSFGQSGTTNIAGATGTTSYYEVSNIYSDSSTNSLLVYGNTTIYCTQTNGAVSIASNGSITLMPGATLNLYTAGSVNILGVVNSNGIPNNLHIYGLPTCTSIECGKIGVLCGVVDAPEAVFTCTASANVFGSVTAYSINIIGEAAVHADEALVNSGPQTFAIYPQANGQMVLSGYGAALACYSIQATTNLCGQTWVPLVTTSTDAGGQLNFVDQDAPNYPSRFYRIVGP